MTIRLLFVCSANISRSPYAERRTSMLVSSDRVAAASAGIPGYPGRPMDPEMARQLADRGGNADGHVSQAVTNELLEHADLVLTFEFAQHLRLLESFPGSGSKVFGMGQFADAADRAVRRRGEPLSVAAIESVAGLDSMGWDVDDPYRRGKRAARACAARVDGLLVRILGGLMGEEVEL